MSIHEVDEPVKLVGGFGVVDRALLDVYGECAVGSLLGFGELFDAGVGSFGKLCDACIGFCGKLC